MSIIRNFILAVVLFSFLILPVSAYLDPGTGSMIWQLLLAVFLSLLYSVHIYWQKIKNYFRNLMK
jgi:hypothetical protein